MVRLPARKDSPGDTRVAHLVVPYRVVCPSRISTSQARRAIRDALCGLELERRAFIEGRLVVIVRDRPPQQIDGATSWKVNGLGDLKVTTPTRVFFFPKSRFRYLLIANLGVLKDQDDEQLLLVAVRPAKGKRAQ